MREAKVLTVPTRSQYCRLARGYFFKGGILEMLDPSRAQVVRFVNSATVIV
jgi:hypothetical protein